MATRAREHDPGQRGAVLIVGLILLVAMTLIGVTAMKLTTLDERIAGNAQQRVSQFQAAESALMETVDYDGVLACAKAKCQCMPTDDGRLPRADCESDGFARQWPPGAATGAVMPSAVAGMAYEGALELYGNSIGVGTAVAGRKVRIRAMTMPAPGSTSVPKKHELLVAPIGLRDR